MAKKDKINVTKMELDYLKSGKTLTSLEAVNLFGGTRLSDTIWRLRRKGYNIETNDKITVNRFGCERKVGEYSLCQ